MTMLASKVASGTRQRSRERGGRAEGLRRRSLRGALLFAAAVLSALSLTAALPSKAEAAPMAVPLGNLTWTAFGVRYSGPCWRVYHDYIGQFTHCVWGYPGLGSYAFRWYFNITPSFQFFRIS